MRLRSSLPALETDPTASRAVPTTLPLAGSIRMNTNHFRPSPRALVPALLGVAALLGSCRSNTVESVTVGGLVRDGQYAEAFALAERQALANPKDAEAQDLYAEMQVIMVLERGRRLLFAGSPTEALALFKDGLALDPDNETVQAWILKTELQLAEEWLDLAQELASVAELNKARTAFEKVLEYAPWNASAKDGLYRIIVRENYHLGLGRDYYSQAIDDLRRYELWAADRSLSIAQVYNPKEERIDARQLEVRRMLAEQRMAQADDLAEKSLFYAARNEYRLVLLIEPDNAAAVTGLNRMDNEARARQALEDAEQKAQAGELDEAMKLLGQGVRFTEIQHDAFTKLEAEVEDRRLRGMYDEAILLYKDQRYPEAVAAFDRLLQATESYDDAISRKRTLEEFIATADQLYARAIESTDPAEALGFLREIEVFWSEYLDIQERIAALEKQVGTDG